MFTGIIEHQGSVQETGGSNLVIKAGAVVVEQLAVGDSIAVNGVCLTVSRIVSASAFAVDIMPETLRVTTLGRLEAGSPLNLELSLLASGRLGGHIVQGHVDGVGTIGAIKRTGNGNDRLIQITADKQLLKYLAEKGSVTVDGIALTLIDVGDGGFGVGIIPHTWQHTTLNKARTGDPVNLEVDILAKYVYEFTRPYAAGAAL